MYNMTNIYLSLCVIVKLTVVEIGTASNHYWVVGLIWVIFINDNVQVKTLGYLRVQVICKSEVLQKLRKKTHKESRSFIHINHNCWHRYRVITGFYFQITYVRVVHFNTTHLKTHTIFGELFVILFQNTMKNYCSIMFHELNSLWPKSRVEIRRVRSLCLLGQKRVHSPHKMVWNTRLVIKTQGAVSIRKTVLPGMAIPMLKIRRPNGRLIFNMEIAIRR